jgi:hypothetical protein
MAVGRIPLSGEQATMTIRWRRPRCILLRRVDWRAHDPSVSSLGFPGSHKSAGRIRDAVTYAALSPLAVGMHFAAAASSGPAGWLVFISGLTIGALTIATAVSIAWWQRVIAIRDRAEERKQDAARQQEHSTLEAKINRREAWQAEYEYTRKILECGEEITYRVRHDGPYTAAGFAALDTATFRMNCERLAERGMERLRDPLLQLAHKADELTLNAVPEEAILVAAFADGHAPDGKELHSVQRLAILQDRVAQDLADQISIAWKVLRDEWGT